MRFRVFYSAVLHGERNFVILYVAEMMLMRCLKETDLSRRNEDTCRAILPAVERLFRPPE